MNRKPSLKYVQWLDVFLSFPDHQGIPGHQGGSMPRGAAGSSAPAGDPVISFIQDKIDSANKMNAKHPGMIEQRWMDKLHGAQDTYRAYVEKYGEDYPIVLIHDQPDVERRPWYCAIIAPSSKYAGEWQATYFDQQGFSGDFQSKTKAEAYWDIYSQGLTRPDPDLLESASNTDLFNAGVKWSMLPEKQKFNTSIEDVLKAGN